MTDPEIKKYLKMNDFYELLGVRKDSTETDIKKAYRKLALKFHPDRNKNVGSTDVFKKISQAYDCLMNPEKKQFYDKYGNEEPQVHQQHYRQRFNQDIDPNDIFSFFFNGQSPFTQQYYHSQNGHHTQNGQNPNRQQNMQFLGLLPILFLLLPTIISLFEAVPTYSMQRTYSHQNRRETINLKVVYYVNDDFFVKSRSDKYYIQRIDFSIEQDYVKNVKDECHYQHINKQRLMRQSQQYVKGSYYEKLLRQNAESLDMRSCLKFEELQQRSDFKKYL